ncbi:MAG: ester cyclase [Acidimicrobiales bacterium]
MTVTPIDTKARERREATLRALLEAQNRHDIAGSVACFAHPRYELVGNQRVYEGAAEVTRYYETTFSAFPDITFELITAHHADDALVVELWMSGSHLGSRRDFEATGKRFRCRAAAVFQFRGADLVGARIYYDTGTIARQLA